MSTNPSANPRRLAVIGGGPAGLMAAESARACGVEVDVYDAMGSVGRKFLIAGKGGLNLTHSEPNPGFVSRYGEQRAEVGRWLESFSAGDVREWARGLGIETFVGSSGRVFPLDLKAAPLLRGWVRRLRASGVRFHVHHRWIGWDEAGALCLATEQGQTRVEHAAVVLATGGASWPMLGSDGAWFDVLANKGIDLAALKPANCGFDVDWSAHLRSRFAGAPVKPVAIGWTAADGMSIRRQGEFVVSADGVEGSLIYALSADLRDAIQAHGSTTILLDLVPQRDLARLSADLARPRGRRSLSEHLRRHVGLDGVKVALLHECVPRAALEDMQRLAHAIKALPLVLRRPRPVAEAISTAGGVRLDALDAGLMLRALPGVFCAGEMLDWEAPTGGYLLTASLASGRIAGRAAAHWLQARVAG